MRRFVKTIVPSDGYEEVKKVGERYLVHLEPADNGDGSVTCYECITDEAPDMTALSADLQTWKGYVAEKALEAAKAEKLRLLAEYDSSEAVNSFELRQGGVKMTDYWLPRDLRTSLDGDVRACQESGRTTYNFDIRELGVTLPLDCAKFLAALTTLRGYAYTAYNVTSQHMAAIGRLATVAAVDEYDFTVGYPPKLVFNLEDLV